MLQPYIESSSALSDIYTDTKSITLPCSFVHVGNNRNAEKAEMACAVKSMHLIISGGGCTEQVLCV